MKILIFRSAAFGDCLCITPVIRYLHSQGHELTVVTSKRGLEVFKNNPHISKLILHKEETLIDKLSDEIDYLRRKNKCDKVLDFSESIEVSLSQHPRSPNYKLPKQERIARFNRNFYEYSFEHIGEKWEGVDLLPELFFDDSEILELDKQSKYKDKIKRLSDVRQFIKPDCYNILLGLSGSGRNKTWAWSQDFAYTVCGEYPDIHIITVGDIPCKLIEPELKGRITNLSGEIPMRASMFLTSLVDLVISPDTGLLHASGCFNTPKIGVLGHNTIECITKHFKNDYSVEADEKLAPCAPCLSLIYDAKLQCPLSPISGGSICLTEGIPLDKVYKQFQIIYAESKQRS